MTAEPIPFRPRLRPEPRREKSMILCAHADQEGRGMHLLEPGETCLEAQLSRARREGAARELRAAAGVWRNGQGGRTSLIAKWLIARAEQIEEGLR